MADTLRQALWFAPIFFAAALCGRPVLAQVNERAAAIEQIVVTAQRRTEDLLDVPITITAIPAETLEAQGVHGIIDLFSVTPGLSVARDNAAVATFIRGVGNTAVQPGQEASNAVYVDGIYVATPSAALFSFNNVERVEVLKGPQGTLFGRNATGGLIHVITRDPSFTPVLSGSLGYGNYDTVEAQLYGSTGISEAAAVDIAIDYRNQRDGWGDNIFAGEDIYLGRHFALRSKLRAEASENTTFELALDYVQGRNSFAGRQISEGALTSDGTPSVGGFYDMNTDLTPYMRNEGGGVSIRMDHDMGWAKLVSLSGYHQDEFLYVIDQDTTPLPRMHASVPAETTQFSQELHITSSADSPLSWIFGLYYFDNWIVGGAVRRSGTARAADGGFNDTYSDLATQSYAAFAQGTLPLSDSTSITAGARYTEDQRHVTGFVVNALGETSSPADQSESWNSPTWRLALEHHFSEHAMTYASYNRGFKSGIFALFSPNAESVNPETLDAYEVGGKFRLLDQRLQLTVSAFYYDYTDIQLTVRQEGLSRLINAAEAEVTGIEAEFLAIPSEGLTLRAGLGVTDGEYVRFPDATFTIPNPAICGTPPEVPMPGPGPRTGGNTRCSGDASGNKMLQTPELTVNVGLDYVRPTPLGEVGLNLAYYYNDGFYWEPDNRVRQDSYSLLSGQVSLALDENFTFRLWGRNILDSDYLTQFSSSLGDFEKAAAPATFGATVDFSF